MKFLNSKQKRAIFEELEKVYGVKEIDYELAEFGKQRLRAFSGNLPKEEIFDLSELTSIEVLGLYLISQKDDDLRLNFDAVSLLKEKISKRITEIDKNQLALWVRGYDLEIPAERGIAVLKFKDDLVGVGKSNGEKIFNYLPKERKIKTPLPKPHNI